MTNQVAGRIVARDLQFADIGRDDLDKFRVMPGDLLFNRTNSFELVGRTAIFELEGDFVFASYLIRLRTASDRLNPLFLNFYLNGDEAQRRLKSIATRAVSQSNISATRLRGFPVPVPPLTEQRQIAAVLSAVQRAIERQERLLALTAELKKALMHKLFTEGTRGEPLKQTEIGQMPKSWGVATLGSVTTTVYRYPTYYNIEYTAAGVPEIRGELLLSNGEIESNPGAYRYISAETAAKFPRVRLEIGDLVMSVRGTMGKVGIVREEQQGGVITANLIRLAPNRRVIVSDYYRWAVMRPSFLALLNAASPQTTIKTITAPALKELRIPLPCVDEQGAIVSALARIEIRHTSHIRRHSVLAELFRTLLHQLMTAQVRVHELDLSALEETARPAGAA
jgi:type I restriction enzyme S subunit